MTIAISARDQHAPAAGGARPRRCRVPDDELRRQRLRASGRGDTNEVNRQ
jgi:hypothetical protein